MCGGFCRNIRARRGTVVCLRLKKGRRARIERENGTLVSGMNLTDEQKAKVGEWARQGESLGSIQKKLEEHFLLQVTYMEMRMLVADLEISLMDKDRGPAKPAVSPEPGAGPLEADGKAKKKAGAVTVKVDSIAQPNTMVSGTVQFGDGQQAYWAVDMMGRLALEPDTPGYRPSEQDVVAFQTELRQALRRAGM